MELWRRAALDYNNDYPLHSFFTDLVELHSILGLTVKYGKSVALANIVSFFYCTKASLTFISECLEQPLYFDLTLCFCEWEFLFIEFREHSCEKNNHLLVLSFSDTEKLWNVFVCAHNMVGKLCFACKINWQHILLITRDRKCTLIL